MQLQDHPQLGPFSAGESARSPTITEVDGRVLELMSSPDEMLSTSKIVGKRTLQGKGLHSWHVKLMAESVSPHGTHRKKPPTNLQSNPLSMAPVSQSRFSRANQKPRLRALPCASRFDASDRCPRRCCTSREAWQKPRPLRSIAVEAKTWLSRGERASGRERARRR